MTLPKLTKAKIDGLIAGVEAGLWDGQNAIRNGIHPTTLADWIARGLRENADEPYAELAQRYLQATTEFEVAVIQIVFEGSRKTRIRSKTTTESSGDPERGVGSTMSKTLTQLRGDWKAAAWYLERRWPTRWGSRTDERHELPLARILESAESRSQDLAQLLANPTPELQAAMLEAREAILALLAPEALPSPDR